MRAHLLFICAQRDKHLEIEGFEFGVKQETNLRLKTVLYSKKQLTNLLITSLVPSEQISVTKPEACSHLDQKSDLKVLEL